MEIEGINAFIYGKFYLDHLSIIDRVALANELKGNVELLLKEKPYDEEMRAKIYSKIKDAVKNLKELENTKEMIEVLTPILEMTKPR